MRAIRIHTFGGRVRLDDVPEPRAEPAEALFDVRLAAVNPLDLWVAEGSVAGGSQPLPFVLGTEAVGVCEGRRMVASGFGLGSARDGLYRERAAVPREALSPVPDEVDDRQAAAVSVVGVTAKRVLDVANLEAGEVVVILGPSGGVGVVAIQLAKQLGATVVAVTSSPDKREDLLRLGADQVIVADISKPSALKLERPADLVLNPLGGRSVAAAVEILAIGGRQVLFGRSLSDEVSFSAGGCYRKNVSVLGYGGLSDPPENRIAAREWILDRIAEGKLHIPIALELPLEQAVDALNAIATKSVTGKVLLRVANEAAA